MIELPEAKVLAQQLREKVLGKKIVTVLAASSPHKFAFFAGEPSTYPDLLAGQIFEEACSYGSFILLAGKHVSLLLAEGVILRYYEDAAQIPPKHQLCLDFEDSSALVCSVKMYGALWAFTNGTFENPYYAYAVEKPSPLEAAFTQEYFVKLVKNASQTLSAKAFLATEQRIPGLGNGVLQDILFIAGIHPQRKLQTFTPEECTALYRSIKETLVGMAELGGRNIEKDLFGCAGGYPTLLCNGTFTNPCTVCGTAIQKKAYLGGSVYFCPVCQPLERKKT